MSYLVSYLRFFIGCSVIFLTATAFSGTEASIRPHQIELSGNLGVSTFHFGNNTLNVTETETDYLRQTHNPAIGEVGAAIAYLVPLKPLDAQSDWTWFPEWRLSFNMQYASHDMFSDKTRGQVEQYMEPSMDNYTYTLLLDSTRLTVDPVLTVASWRYLSAFATAGIGYAWNKLHYQDVPNPGIEEGGLLLNDRNNTGFAWEIGAGLFYNCTDTVKISAQYLYTDFGTVSTSTHGTLNGLSTTISPAHFSLHSNAVLFGIHVTL